MVDSWLDDNTANRHKQTYVKGFVDISGGDLILRNGQQYVEASYNYSTTDISGNSITSSEEITVNPVWSQLGHSVTATGTSGYYYIDMNKDGTIIIVGETDSYSTRGIARVFQYTNNAWTQLGVDLSGNNTSDYFGHSPSINADGTIISIGTNGGNYCKVFEYDVTVDGSWNQLGSTFTTTDSPIRFGSFTSLDASGHRLILDDRNYNSGRGYVEIYDYNSGTNSWTQVGSRINGTDVNAYFGYSLKLSGDGNRFITGAPGYNSYAGFAKVYEYDDTVDGSWNQLGSTFYGGGGYIAADNSLAINYDGSIVIVGANSNDEDGTDRGKIQVFIYNTSTSSWDQLGEDIFGRENSSHLAWRV
jgi:hypothetical protein